MCDIRGLEPALRGTGVLSFTLLLMGPGWQRVRGVTRQNWLRVDFIHGSLPVPGKLFKNWEVLSHQEMDEESVP